MSINQNLKSKAVIEQVTNNTTSWIGHRNDNKDFLCGQTFIAPHDGDLESIEVFPSIVTKPGKVVMTLHNFDPQQKIWGPAIGSTSLELSNSNSDKWVSFKMPGMLLNQGKSYGFRLESENAYVGLGEAVGSHLKPPFLNGQEWKFVDKDQQGNSFTYFSLAFKVGLRA